ncbi:NAD(P)-binding protein [Ramaria rubella]|nr:NAD(P)-binding protein [Ramaria rubella]
MAAKCSGQTALILGATGAVGKHLLRELLSSPNYMRVGEFGRRTTPLDTRGLANTHKLVQKTIDFEKLEGLADEKWDVVYITMGTYLATAGSTANFIKIDQDYVVNSAQAAKRADHTQRLVYCSAVSANRSSYLPYSKSKGQTEDRLAALGYADTIVFRPSMLLATNRGKSRPLETLVQSIVSPLTALTARVGISAASLAKSMRIVGELGSDALPSLAQAIVTTGSDSTIKFTLVPNKGAMALSKL